MQNRREFLFFLSLCGVACLSERAIAKGKAKKMLKKQQEKKASKTTCSGKRNLVLKKCTKKPEAGQTPAQCKSAAEVRYQKCLKQGSGSGKTAPINLNKGRDVREPTAGLSSMGFMGWRERPKAVAAHP